MFSVKAKPTPTMPAYTIPSRMPSSSCLRAHRRSSTKRPFAPSSAIVAPITEEGAKGLFVLLLLWARRHELDGILDGIVYAGMVGVGFAFTENILYLTGAYM